MLEAIILGICLVALSYAGTTGNVLMFILLLFAIPGIWAMLGGAPFVPTSKKTMDTMFRLAAIRPKECVYDLGCGDGRFVRRAARMGAIATGYELSVPTFALAKLVTLPQNSRACIRCKNFWTQNYADADVIFCYLLQETMQKFERTIWPTLKPGCRVVSHNFSMNHVKPEEHENCVYLYVK